MPIPTPKKRESQQDFVGRCMGADAMQEYDQEQRAAICYSTFRSRHSENEEMVVSAISTATCAAHPETFLGRKFLVVPAVLVRSQVLRNNLGTTLLPEDEITDAWAAQWNGIPVLVGPHPSRMGEQITGRDPSIWNSRAVGWLFNVRAGHGTDGVRRLTGDVWLDQTRSDVEGFQAVLDKIAAGERVELSTGFPVEAEDSVGTHRGRPYQMLLHPRGADHLVISTEMTGACGIADGCGLGANSEHGEVDMAEMAGSGTPPATGLKAILGKVAELFGREVPKLTAEDLAALRLQRVVAEMELTPSDNERQQMLQEALQARFGASDRQVVVTDVYSAPEQMVIFFLSGGMGAQPKGAEYYRLGWAEAENKVKVADGDPELVRRMVKYEPVASSGPAGGVGTAVQEEPPLPQEDEMAEDTKKLEELVGNLATQVQGVVTAIAELKSAGAPAELAGLKRSMAELAEKINSMEGVTRAAINERERERQSLVAELAGNYRVPFTSAELEAKPVEELRKLQGMVKAENYIGRGGPGAGDAHQQAFAEPVPYWQRKRDGAAKEGE